MKKSEENKKYLNIFFAIVCLIGLIYWGSMYFTDYIVTNDAYIEGKLISVNPKVAGLVTHIYAEETQEVKKGDLILELDASQYQFELREAETKLKEARTKLGLGEIGEDGTPIRKEKSNMFKSVFSKFKFPHSDFEDYHKNYGEDIFPKVKEETDANSLTAPETKLKTDKEKIKEPEKEKVLTEAEEKDLESEIKKLEVEVEQAKLNLSYTKVFAPQDGIVSVCSVREGEYIYVGQSVMSIIPKRVWVKASFSNEEASNMDIGQAVIVKISKYPYRNFRGMIDNISKENNSAENSQKTTVRIVFTEDYSDFDIPPGTSVKVKVRKN